MKTTPPIELDKTYTVKIVALNDDAEGVARIDGFTCFIPNTLIDEEVEIKITEIKKSFSRALLVKIIKESTKRVEASCQYYSECGGCGTLHIDYEEQLKIKTDKIKNALQRIAKLETVNVSDCIASPNTTNYRNKIELSIVNENNKLLIGFKKKGSHSIIDIEVCNNINSLGNKILKELRASLLNISIKQQKQLNSVIIKTDSLLKNAMIIFRAKRTNRELESLLIKDLKNIDAVKSIIIRTEHNSSKKTIYGEGLITDQFGEYKLFVGPTTFSQINPKVANLVYNKAISLFKNLEKNTLIDAFAGTGAIAIYAAKSAGAVLIVEENPEACTLAKENLKMNKIKNAKIIKHNLDSGFIFKNSTRKIILDPPRGGCSKSLLENIAISSIDEIVYISCKPSTLARDIMRLSELGFSSKLAYPFDMFPNTSHVETVIKLERV